MISPLVAICAATYRRPQMLAQLLDSLSILELDGLNVHLIIADNDIAQSAKATVESAAQTLPFPVSYVIEATRGLASVRNRLVKEAQSLSADFIAFIDDDETAHPHWLLKLHLQAEQSLADAVMGRQIRWMDDETPEYIKQCFPSPHIRSGKRIQRFSTANVLIRTKSLEGIHGPFETRLNLTGGEDSMLSAQLAKHSKVLVWCNEAETYEYVPPSRRSPSYILRRAFRSGTTRSKIVRWSDSSPGEYILHFCHSFGIIVKHSTLILPNAITQRNLLLFRVRCIVSGVGGIVGIITTRAFSHQEYATTHGF